MLDKGELKRPPPLSCMVDHDERDEREGHCDRDVLVVESDVTDAGEDDNGVVDVLGSS